MAQIPGAGSRGGGRLADVMQLLGLLARRGCHVPVGGTGSGAAVVLDAGDGLPVEIGRASALTLAAAQARGWIGPGPRGDRLALTVSGRRALKRALSRIAQARADGSGPAPGARGATPVTNPCESPLGWLRSRRDAGGRPLVTDEQFAAGERLRAELTFAQLTPRVTMSWSGLPGSGSGMAAAGPASRDLADNVVAARARVAAALRAVGPEFAGLLIDVCGHLKGLEAVARAEGWPARSAKLLLQRALSALARHYGLLPHVPVERTLAERLRHWGTDDYRPTLARREPADHPLAAMSDVPTDDR